MTKPLSREEMIGLVQAAKAAAEADRIPQAPEIMRVPASIYTDPARFDQEVAMVFRRLPLVVTASAELKKPGDYKALTIAGLPILAIRGDDGAMRVFLNSCPHRGANVALPGCGQAKRLTCPYHGWTFTKQGALIGIAREEDFGAIDKAAHSLIALPTLERAGLIWAILNPKSTLSIEAYLSGYDRALAHFGFADWHLFSQRTIPGPNWKIAYDGYLDLYHLPVLHKATFGPQMPNRALYQAWGPHQRVQSPASHLIGDGAPPEAAWDASVLLAGVWTIFPHVSIASFDAGGRGVMISLLTPGAHVGESLTTQLYLMEKEPTEEQAKVATEQFAVLEYVVRQEDYDTGLRQQQALASGAREWVLFGRNEGGAQTFHGWVDRLLQTSDDNLPTLFKA
jgi:phenylpropionate dioxygenase-like ring-hydroxylating dioxygenase large terminal subunit